jgi:phage gpG-like protein|nr:MAG TPA: virion morphogenesis protein [Caudoviricetes sp.]
MTTEITPIIITVDSSAIEAALDRLARAARDLRPAMRDIGGLLEKETDENFRAQGRPPWPPLSQATILNRLMGRDRKGKSKGIASILRKDGDLRASAKRKLEGGLAILQNTGALRSSIRARPDRDSVTVGSVLEYAAIHQFGGMAGRGKKVRIPARPFIPVNKDGRLAPDAERGVLAAIYDHLAESV